MSALSADRNTAQMGLGIPQRMSYPVLTGVTIYKGALVVIDSSGYAKPGVAAETTDVCVGRASQQVVAGSAASGTYTVEVEQGVFKWAVNGTAVTIADLGALCYVYDDQTVTKSSSSASIAGTIYGVDASGTAWVYMGLAPAVDGTSLTALTSTVSQLKTNLMVPYTVPVILSSATTSAVVARFTPGMSGTINRMNASVIQAVTTTAKLATLTPNISAVAVSGGVLALTSTALATLGASVSGTAVAGTNTFTASQEITVTASSVTAFTEGQILLELFLQTA